MEMLDLLDSLKDIRAERKIRDSIEKPIDSSNIDSYRKIDELMPPPYEFEKRVITFLWDSRERYQIDELIRFQNSSVDGSIKAQGITIPFEIKYRMNWLKACQAMWQFKQFRTLSPDTAFDTGLVFFHSFSADWARSPVASPIPNGWRNWYSDHARSETMTVHLVRLEDGHLETYKELKELQQSSAER